MRKLRCIETYGVGVSEVLDEFNTRAADIGVAEADVVNVLVRPAGPNQIVTTAGGDAQPATVVVSIIHWADA